MSTAAIELTGVEKRLGQFHLGPLSLTVPRGAIYGLIGPNGAGKSTTLDLLMGMGQPDGGVMRLLDRDPEKDEVEIKRRTAYVSPDLSYGLWGKVGSAIQFMSKIYPDWDHVRCARLQVAFDVPSDQRVAALSFGARVKLTLIMALSRNVELLLLDEPTLGLDPVARRRLFEELLALMQDEERTIVISSHQLSDLERFADHVAILDEGRLRTSGRMDQMVERFKQLRVRSTPALSGPLPGIFILRRDSEFTAVVIDTTLTSPSALTSLGIEVLGDSPLTLEEVFVAISKRGTAA